MLPVSIHKDYIPLKSRLQHFLGILTAPFDYARFVLKGLLYRTIKFKTVKRQYCKFQKKIEVQANLFKQIILDFRTAGQI